MTNEQGNVTIEYSDKEGRIVQKEQVLNTTDTAKTAYVFNDIGQLSFVVQPKVYTTATSFSLNSSVFLEGCFGYFYDSKGRLIEKHVPGAGFSRMIYDKLNRVVLENDDKDAASSPNFYKFTRYDVFNRPIQTGLINNIGNFSRTQLQTDFDNHQGPISEERGTGLLGYTNVSFPSSYMPQDGNMKTVSYFDDLLWNSESAYNFQATNAYHPQYANVKGMMTGGLVRNLETGDWYKAVNYYDYKGRGVQTFAQNHLGGIDRMEYQYRFNNEVLKMRTTHRKTGATDIVEISEFDYDNWGRKTKFKHSLNGSQKTIAKYVYDNTGRLKQKAVSPTDAIGSSQAGLWTNNTTWKGGSLPTLADKVTINQGHTVTIPSGQIMQAGTLFNQGILQNFGVLQMGTLAANSSTNAGTLQTIDFKYHIRGFLSGINLDASGNLTNKLFSMKLSFENSGYYDGNIGKQEWKSSLDNVTRSFTYGYDKSNRILGASYAGNGNENYSLENMSYDANGNILSLSRKGKTGANSYGYVDQLSYVYESNSNKIKKVSDLQGLSNQNVGDFRDSSNVTTEYEYWQDGSLKIDRNKKISQVDYNYLKLPKLITFEGGQWIRNQYDASGKKLKSTTSDGIIYDFVGNMIYKNNTLYQIGHDEGRIVNNEYEYDYKDHLGNVRVSFRDSSGIAKVVTKYDYDPWGLILKGLEYKNPTFNKNNFQFGSKEKTETFGLNWIDFGARQYMPDVPHFTTIDPAGEYFNHESSYCYAGNNPLSNIDVGGVFKIDANFARKYPTAAKLIAYYLPQLVNNRKVVSYFMKQYNLSREQVIENFKYNSGPTIYGTEIPVAWIDDASLPVFASVSGRYDSKTGKGKYKNNIYIGHYELEELEKSFKSKNVNSLGINMFKVSSLIVHEYAHYLNYTYNTSNADYAEGNEQGAYSEKEIYGEQFSSYPERGSIGTLNWKGYYNKNKSSEIMIGMSLSMQEYFNNYFLSKFVGLPVEDLKKKDPSGSKVSGGND